MLALVKARWRKPGHVLMIDEISTLARTKTSVYHHWTGLCVRYVMALHSGIILRLPSPYLRTPRREVRLMCPSTHSQRERGW